MTAAAFVDTNLLLYAFDATDPERQGPARRWLDHLWHARAGRTRVQVLQEFYVNATRPVRPLLAVEDARAIVRGLAVWNPVRPDASLLFAAWDLQDRFSLSWWDALVVAAARRTEAEILLTEDLQDGQDFGGIVVVDPFQRPPQSA